MRRVVRYSFVAVGIVATAVLVGLLLLTRIEGGPEADESRAINIALNSGARPDYVAAIAAVRRAESRPGDGDAHAASLLLDSLADPGPATRPPGTVEGALRMMENAAVADRVRNAPFIEATMRYGVINPRVAAPLLAPSPTIAACWARVAAQAEQSTTCIRLRRAGG